MFPNRAWLAASFLAGVPALAFGQPDIDTASSTPTTAATAAVVPGIAVADTAPAAEPTAERPESRSRLIEEIVVTAQRREENLMDVPISISAFSEEKLDAAGIEAAQDLERLTPGLTITRAAGFTIAYLRGVGTDAFLPGADPSVPFYIDGVALLGIMGSNDTLGRVDRVEVLKGPQGTLFGRNATGGAISIVTPTPNMHEWTGDLGLELAEYKTRNLLAYLSGPLADGFGVSLSAYSNDQDNFYRNTAGPVLDIYARGARAKLLWEITDDLSMTLAGSVSKTSNNAGLIYEMTRRAPLVGAVLPEDPKADCVVSTDSPSGAQNESHMLALTTEWQLPWLNLKFIGSDQEVKAPFAGADFDKSALPLINMYVRKQVSKQRTAELQFLSNADTLFSDRFEWVGGLYYLDSSGGYDPIAFEILPGALTSLGIPGVNALVGGLNGLLASLNLQPLGDKVQLLNGGILDSESYSAYFQGSYQWFDSVDLTAGIRYQREDRNLLHSRLSLPNADGSELVLREDTAPELQARQWAPKLALKWQPDFLDGQIFTSWARGFKSPTYNTVNLLTRPSSVKEEKVDSFEIGFKTLLLDKNLQLNGAIFHIEQQDMLTGFVALTSGGVVTYDNAGDGRIRGAEADFLWSPMPDSNPGLVLVGGATYLDAKYTDYPNGRGYDEATGLAFGDEDITVLGSRDFTGNRIVRTPKLTYTFGINQRFAFGPGDIEVGADVYYNDGFYFLPQNSDLYARDSYHLYNARVSYFHHPWNLQLTAFADNLTDVTYNEHVFVDDFGRNQILNAPRVIGVRGKWSF